MDKMTSLILAVCIVVVTTFIIKVLTDRNNDVKIRQECEAILDERFKNINKTHQALWKSAQYYIDNEYVYDIRPYLHEYVQKRIYYSSWAEKLRNVYEKCRKNDEWREMLLQVHTPLDYLEAEQMKFFEQLALCEQEEEKYKKAFAKYGPKTEEKDSFEVSGLFNGCTDYESLHKRYKALMKVYHSDIENGDNEMATKINAEYERLKKKYSK